jgi:hypothetical protein
VPAFGNVYVNVTGLAFGPAGDRPPVLVGVFPETVFGPKGPNAFAL